MYNNAQVEMTPGEQNVHDIPHMRNRLGVFRNRTEAGEVLSGMLEEYRGTDSLVLAIPAGGVPVAAVVARALQLPLDVAVVSKICPPQDSEVGYGAVAFDGTLRLNERMVPLFNLSEREVRDGIAVTREKVERRVRLFRGERESANLGGRRAILIDDGLASGFTMTVAVEAVRNAGAHQIVIAVPTAHAGAVRGLSGMVNSIYCPNVRIGSIYAVADAYTNWCDVSEQTAAQMLKEFHQRAADRNDQTQE